MSTKYFEESAEADFVPISYRS